MLLYISRLQQVRETLFVTLLLTVSVTTYLWQSSAVWSRN